MNLLFEENGEIKAGQVLDSSGVNESMSYQVELTTGRRAKVKASQVMLKFAQPDAATVLREAHDLSATLDPCFLWEVAPPDEFEATSLGTDYFGTTPTPSQWLALVLCLQNAPVYFRRKGKGRFKAAPEHELRAALAGLEKKRLLHEQQSALAEQLKRGALPDGWKERAAQLIFKPDKNSVEYKALDQAAGETQMPAIKLLMQAGAFSSAQDVHFSQFVLEWFPRGTAFATTPPFVTQHDLPLANVSAFSIDDSTTTEIDDAFSVQWVSDKVARIGIHIAAPGIGFSPGSELDALARQRLSTVYMPGKKITMLPEPVLDAFTLSAGRHCPALSLYADFDVNTGECLTHRTTVEAVYIAKNLRHDELDDIVTETSLEDPQADFPFKHELQTLWMLTLKLSAQREQVRGKPEPRNRADFSFRIETRGDVEQVIIEPRQRDAPLDRLVAEWMIFANSTWGKVLADANVPGIYRTQTHWARPGSHQSSVRMSTVAAPHIGLGVNCYAWSSSPLRRYVDLINQWQLIAVTHGTQPHFDKDSSVLFSIIGSFDAAYSAYGEAQATLERYWSLRWLQQENYVATGRTLNAVVVRHEQVRLLDAPLASSFSGNIAVDPGTPVEVEVLAVDELMLSVALRLRRVLNAEAETATIPH